MSALPAPDPDAPSFDVTEDLACLVFTHVRDLRDRLKLSAVSKVWRDASRRDASFPSRAVMWKFGEAFLEPANRSNHRKALEWFRRAATGGDAVDALRFARLFDFASEDAARLYLHNAGVWGARARVRVVDGHPRSIAAEWYEIAAEKGNAEAQDHLGALYRDGAGVPRDAKKAVALFTKAAEQGLSCAMWRVGYCYQYGSGVEEDSEMAVSWSRKSAEDGDPNAQLRLGRCYYYGEGVTRDVHTAVEWWLKAATSQPHPHSTCKAAEMATVELVNTLPECDEEFAKNICREMEPEVAQRVVDVARVVWYG